MNSQLLTLEEAAAQLGYSASGLRKIVNNTKSGKCGAAIQFFQVGRGPIKFRQEWLDEFVEANATIPMRPRTAAHLQHLGRPAA
jgi:hypothetical protein